MKASISSTGRERRKTAAISPYSLTGTARYARSTPRVTLYRIEKHCNSQIMGSGILLAECIDLLRLTVHRWHMRLEYTGCPGKIPADLLVHQLLDFMRYVSVYRHEEDGDNEKQKEVSE